MDCDKSVAAVSACAENIQAPNKMAAMRCRAAGLERAVVKCVDKFMVCGLVNESSGKRASDGPPWRSKRSERRVGALFYKRW